MEKERRDGRIYREKKEEYRELCDRKKRRMKNAKRGQRMQRGRVTFARSSERKGRKKINEEIGIEEWGEYFA